MFLPKLFFSLTGRYLTRPRVPSNLARILSEVEPITQRPQREASERAEGDRRIAQYAPRGVVLCRFPSPFRVRARPAGRSRPSLSPSPAPTTTRTDPPPLKHLIRLARD
ncbi:hypothetical protein PVAP13_4KG072233 [Panicum virgatum]|uniref:Uncharacterized protein n=1 Tax=Panicum virgatum TaxID=38727 RepID=A0A8T0TL84_PANVG|nr:hypothetical protein PVAP13_4KG072233 [Panicum virgatum]